MDSRFEFLCSEKQNEKKIIITNYIEIIIVYIYIYIIINVYIFVLLHELSDMMSSSIKNSLN